MLVAEEPFGVLQYPEVVAGELGVGREDVRGVDVPLFEGENRASTAMGTNVALVSRYTDCIPAKPCCRPANSGRAPKVKDGRFPRSSIVRSLLACAKAAVTVTVSVFSNGVSSLSTTPRVA